MKCKCLRCGYKWKTLYDKKPKVCPRCKSYYWDSKAIKEKAE